MHPKLDCLNRRSPTAKDMTEKQYYNKRSPTAKLPLEGLNSVH
jgi:hypothetical protein